jgi:UDP-N-acetylmuramoylalanine--D-glutamate ligase
MNRLAGKVAIITGGNSGVGAATAVKFAAEGAKVVITARREAPLLEVADQIRAAVENAPDYTPGKPALIDCEDFTDAVQKSAAYAQAGDVVLMSPASAAFDQFKNFMERGKYFKKLVMEL